MNVALVYRGRYQVREALDLETLSALLAGAGHSVTFVHDPDTFGVTDNVLQIGRLARLLETPEKVLARIVAAEPDAVVFSVLPNTYRWARAIASRLKGQVAAPIIFMGLHPSLAARRVARDECVDYVIEGEAEGVILPLLEAAGDDVSAIGNVWRRVGGEPCLTFRADLVDLDSLPLPDKELFRPLISHAYSYCAMVSRGCPYQCSFCEETCSKKLYGSAYFRRKSVDTVMHELVTGKRRYRYREVVFKDSYLSGNRAWLAELMRRYRAEIRVPFKCFCTILGFDEDTARLLRESGCYNIEFGLQTWNSRVRRQVLNRRETNTQAFRVFGYCADAGLRYDVDHMFNLPGEAEKDHILGARCYRRLRHLNRVKVHFLLYLPRADIIGHGIREGVFPEDGEERLEEGWESDFYDQMTADTQEAKIVSGYAALYKLLPLLPRRVFDWLLRRKRVRFLGRIPSPLMALLQGLIALERGDLRFAAYLQAYPVKAWHGIRSALFR